MSSSWKHFQNRLSKGEKVEEIMEFEKEAKNPSQIGTKEEIAYQTGVVIGGQSYELKPMIPTKEQLVINQTNKELVVPSASIPVSQLLPL